MSSPTTLQEAWVLQEVIELHQFFEDWFQGNIDPDPERFVSVMAGDFVLIPPEGHQVSRHEIIDLIKKGFSSRSDSKIWVENIETRIIGEIVIATYHEVQAGLDQPTRRISSAVFSYKAKLPNHCQWHHVHETWVVTDK